MQNKEHLTKVYKKFSDFIAEASARELEYYILDAKFTTEFNANIKNIFDEIIKEGKTDVEFMLLFNTEGEIVLIDADIIGKYVANKYTIGIEEFYKDNSLNKIIKSVVNGTPKAQLDFVKISYKLIYEILRCMYKEIKYRKEIGERYKEYYLLNNYKKEDIGIIISIIMILEDICKYMHLNTGLIFQCIDNLL